jgi:hypothetical protein
MNYNYIKNSYLMLEISQEFNKFIRLAFRSYYLVEKAAIKSIASCILSFILKINFIFHMFLVPMLS